MNEKWPACCVVDKYEYPFLLFHIVYNSRGILQAGGQGTET